MIPQPRNTIKKQERNTPATHDEKKKEHFWKKGNSGSQKKVWEYENGKDGQGQLCGCAKVLSCRSLDIPTQELD